MKSLSLFAALVSIASASGAETLRYQGELMDRGKLADGAYDLILTPFADPLSTKPLAGPMSFENVIVQQGFFYLEPDFGAAVSLKNGVWIELSIRDGDSPLAYARISDRHQHGTNGARLQSRWRCGRTSGERQ